MIGRQRPAITSELQMIARARAYGWERAAVVPEGASWRHAGLRRNVLIPAGWSFDRALALLVGLTTEIRARVRGSRFVRARVSNPDLLDTVEELDHYQAFITGLLVAPVRGVA